MNKNDKRKIGGFPVNSLIIPLCVILAVLMISVALLTKGVNRTTGDLAELMLRSADFQQAATKLQAGTSVLSETVTGFVQVPVLPGGPDAGTLNVGPLQAYAEELAVDRRPAQIAAYFRDCGLDEELQGYIDTAAADSEQLQEIQTHAISLILSVYPPPDSPALAPIERIQLTAEEQAMPAEARLAQARGLLLDRSYSMLKSDVSKNIESFHAAVQKQFSIATAVGQRHVFSLRTAVWTIITLIFVVLALTFVLFYRWIVEPLRRYAKDMTSDQPLKQQGRIKELRTMVSAYNELLDRRNRLEAILRTAAETDALTGLPNRYHLEQHILDLDPADGALAVLLFDVNYLKNVNDTKGHLAGDQLIRSAARTISECFATEEDAANCFRVGGDEFAAVLRGCTEAEVQARIEAFRRALEREGISISVGYAISEAADQDSFHQLAAQADERMYADKQQIHALASDGNGADRSSPGESTNNVSSKVQ